MTIHLLQNVNIVGRKFPNYWEKDYESSVIPTIGMKIEDPIWKEPYEYAVIEVIIDYYEDACYVTLEEYKDTIPISHKDEFAHVANLHGWKCDINW